MIKSQCSINQTSKIDDLCCLCDNRAKYIIFAKNWVSIKTKLVCREHAIQWNKNELNI